MNAVTKLAQDLATVLDAYIQVHDDIYKFSLRKMLPIPGLFRPIHYCQHGESLSSMAATLSALSRRTYETGTPASGSLNELLGVMSEYTNALLATITKLRDICARFCTSTKGLGNYSMHEFNADTKDYDTLVERYRRIGVRLNELYSHHRTDTGF